MNYYSKEELEAINDALVLSGQLFMLLKDDEALEKYFKDKYSIDKK